MSELSNPLVTPIYKSYFKLLMICANASLSAFFVGYSLVYMGSLSVSNFSTAILDDYGFNKLDWSHNSTSLYKSLIQGAIPVGAIVGALLSSQVIKYLSRRY